MNSAAVAPPLPTSRVGAWLMATRPKTLVASVVPVAAGSAVAAHAGQFRALPALAALLGALCIQVFTNLVNDYADFEKGADTEERVGPPRAVQSGLLSLREVKLGAVVACLTAVLFGLYLVAVGGWPVVAIGLASLFAAWAYTGGPWPLGYHGLGDPFVFLFFGLVAVGGTYLVQAGGLAPGVWWAAVPVGALGTALIVVNNLRDVATDVKAGKRTLAVRFGAPFARAEWLLLVAAAFVLPVVQAAVEGRPTLLLPLLALPLVRAPLALVRHGEGRALLPALAQTAKLQAIWGLLFTLGTAL